MSEQMHDALRAAIDIRESADQPTIEQVVADLESRIAALEAAATGGATGAVGHITEKQLRGMQVEHLHPATPEPRGTNAVDPGLKTVSLSPADWGRVIAMLFTHGKDRSFDDDSYPPSERTRLHDEVCRQIREQRLS